MGFPKAELGAPELQLLKEQQSPGGMAGAAPTPINNLWRVREAELTDKCQSGI